MRSAASLHGHPIHAMLIGFPFAYLMGSFAFALGGAMMRRRELTSVSRHLIPVGIATGLAAAVPGLIDYTQSVPPASSAKERATKHAVINSTALSLFAAAWFAGRNGRRGLPLALQALGTAALSVGGWLGGTLVYRNQIGVDHRYAGAGKWKEAHLEAPGGAAPVADLAVDQMKLLHAGDRRVVVARTDRGYAAFDDRCTHRGGPLSDGVLICGTVQCPWHGSQFDVHSGEVKCGPATTPIEVVRTLSLPPAPESP
ncbi:MAG: DUF2231 domain-containing protein [Vicinamibacterales bacterium]